MSFLKGVLNQFINVIEWTAEDKETMVHRFDTEGRQIMNGAQLTVRESQVAVFVSEGVLCDIFPPGRYELTTANIPIMTALSSWKYGFNSPFIADVYFVNMTQFTDRKWGTTNPVMMRDADFGIVRLRANGNYAFRVVDPQAFLKEVFGTSTMYKVDDIDDYLRNVAVSSVSEAIAKTQLPALDLAMHYTDIGKATQEVLNPRFADMGLSITAFYILNISLPPEVEAKMDTRTSMGVLGDLGAFTQYQTAVAIGDAANNPGIGGAGAGLGVGMGVGQIVANAMQPPVMQPQVQQPVPQAPVQPAVVPVPVPVPAAPEAANLVACPKCGRQGPAGTFCPECGTSLVAPAPAAAASVCVHCGKPIAPGAKFCPDCGKPQALACPACNRPVDPGTKFCPDCGTKI